MKSADIVAPDGTLLGWVSYNQMYPEDRSHIQILIAPRKNEDERSSKYKIHTFELSREGYIYVDLITEEALKKFNETYLKPHG